MSDDSATEIFNHELTALAHREANTPCQSSRHRASPAAHQHPYTGRH